MKGFSPAFNEALKKSIHLHPAQKDLITRAGKSKIMTLSPRSSGKSTLNGLGADMIIIDEISDIDPKSWNTVTVKGRIKIGQEEDQRNRIHTESPIRGSW